MRTSVDRPAINGMLHNASSNLWSPCVDQLIDLKIGQHVLGVVSQMDCSDDRPQPVAVL